MPDDAVGALCVLASGSRGNCSVLVVPDRGTRRVVLIDAGLSPRRTASLLHRLGIEAWEIDAILLTHLDSDHAKRSWTQHRHVQAPVFIHTSHRGQARRIGLFTDRVQTFCDAFQLFDRVHVQPCMLQHDQLGVVAYRFTLRAESDDRRCVLGFATDVGRPSRDLIDHVSGCDVLGIESNYCPVMQQESNRPEFLKRRIMGGSGHLSNEQCLDVVRQARPRDHVVLLHLSEQCNDPERVARLHEGEGYRLTISNQHRPTPWIWLRAGSTQHDRPAGGGRRAELPLWAEGRL
ncbi:MAG: MBL fold metallo-hydrolase [Phycisphaerales bacterium]